MAIMWNGSLIPWLDPNGTPYSGAKAYFFDANTTTPQVTYTTADLSIPHDHPVVANAGGQFPAIFLEQGQSYRLRIVTQDDVTIWDVDDISVPVTEVPLPPEGDTPLVLLARTGDLKFRYGVGAHSGWVRANGRTIGNPTSGASERANDDVQGLFEFLWAEDTSLVVSGGRGVSAAGDFAASKTIELPDMRGRVPGGMDGMGGVRSNRLGDDFVDGSDDADTLGASLGADRHELTSEENGPHTHTVASGGNYNKAFQVRSGIGGVGGPSSNTAYSPSNSTLADNGGTRNENTAVDHTHTLATSGEGEGHLNVQPTLLATWYVKL